MATTPEITWTYHNFCTLTTYGEYSNVVFNYSYTCTATLNGQSREYIGSVGVNLKNPSRLVSYETLTYETIHSWTASQIPMANIEASVTDELFKALGLKQVGLPAPWTVSTSA